MRRELLIAALLLPLAAIGFGIARAELHLEKSRDWVFDVEGYDPRDLLRGHYIQYRIAFHEDEPLDACADGEQHCCLCLMEQGQSTPPTVQRQHCAQARPRCDGLLHTRYLDQLRRYYVAEERAVELTARLQRAASDRTARVMLAIDGEGKPQVKALLVDGERIESKSR